MPWQSAIEVHEADAFRVSGTVPHGIGRKWKDERFVKETRVSCRSPTGREAVASRQPEDETLITVPDLDGRRLARAAA